MRENNKSEIVIIENVYRSGGMSVSMFRTYKPISNELRNKFGFHNFYKSN
jgi:hypothetical protein